MKFIRLEPPGTLCHHAAIFDMLKGVDGRSFVEVGCGAGELSYKLCQRGYRGLGIDFSAEALRQAGQRLQAYCQTGQFRLLAGNIVESDQFAAYTGQFDLALSMMVLEHVEDEKGFLRNLSQFVKNDGLVLVAVPGRRDRWGIEDETVGHLRRYARAGLQRTLQDAGLSDVVVWSVAVPVANVLFLLGNHLLRQSAEVKKLTLRQKEQTKQSGIQDIPFKTVFPAFFSVILHPVMLSPLFLLQRCFYQTDRGLILLGRGTVKSARATVELPDQSSALAREPSRP